MGITRPVDIGGSMPNPPLVIDSRQQRGKHNHKNKWFNEHGVETVTRCLDFGDYMVSTSNVVIDTKKDVDELSLDVGKDHARFVRELDRAAASGCRLVVLIEQHPEYNDRENLRHWSGYVCRKCRKCDPNGGDRCATRKYTPMHGARLAKILDKLEENHGAKFVFCSKSKSAQIICDMMGIPYD